MRHQMAALGDMLNDQQIPHYMISSIQSGPWLRWGEGCGPHAKSSFKNKSSLAKKGCFVGKFC